MSKLAYNMFCKDVNFLQKVVIFHPKEHKKFLALRRSQTDSARPGDWDLVGGHVKFGEDGKESIQRETEEEVDIGIKNLLVVHIDITYPTEKVCKLFIGYTGLATSEVIHLSGEHDSYLWVTAEEFKKLTKTQFLLDLADAIK